jgi:hypothetical protein
VTVSCDNIVNDRKFNGPTNIKNVNGCLLQLTTHLWENILHSNVDTVDVQLMAKASTMHVMQAHIKADSIGCYNVAVTTKNSFSRMKCGYSLQTDYSD